MTLSAPKTVLRFLVLSGYIPGMEALSNPVIRSLKARAQRMKAGVKVGKDGLSPRFIAGLNETLKHCELVKVKFDEFKEQKKELAVEMALKTSSHLVTRVGNVVVLFKPKPVDDPREETDAAAVPKPPSKDRM